MRECEFCGCYISDDGEEMPRTVELSGSVLIRYPRRWWQWRLPGWHRHVDGYGRPCWIAFQWTREQAMEAKR